MREAIRRHFLTMSAFRWSAVRWAVLAIVAALALTFGSHSAAFAQRGRVIAPRAPIYHPRPVFLYPRARFFGFYRAPFYSFRLGSGLAGIWWPQCGEMWTYGCNMPIAVYEPVFLYGGPIQRPDLILKDGTTYTVTDYWLVDNVLHFKTVEQGGTMSQEHTIPFDQLDLQKTVDWDSQRGFRFVLRKEPMQQYFKDHPELGTPGAALPPALPPSAQPQAQPPQAQPQPQP